MRLMSFLVLVAFMIASLIPDLLAQLVARVNTQHLVSYKFREYLHLLDGVPWTPFVFGATFGTVTAITAEEHVRPTKEDVFAYVLIVTLVFIILQYGGVFVAPMLALAHIDFYLFARTMSALFIALVAWKGLHIPLGGLGVFLTTLLALGMVVSGMVGIPMPISFDAYWFTIIGTFMGFFAAFSRS